MSAEPTRERTSALDVRRRDLQEWLSPWLPVVLGALVVLVRLPHIIGVLYTDGDVASAPVIATLIGHAPGRPVAARRHPAVGADEASARAPSGAVRARPRPWTADTGCGVATRLRASSRSVDVFP